MTLGEPAGIRQRNPMLHVEKIRVPARLPGEWLAAFLIGERGITYISFPVTRKQ